MLESISYPCENTVLRPVSCVLLLVLISRSTPVEARDTVLVKNGEGRSTIVVPAKEEETLRAAAEDLVYHLEKMSGARIPIVSDPALLKGVPIYIGVRPEGIQLPVDLADESRFWPDGYLIVADGEKVILAAPRVEGIRNAVYGLLEDYLGCHWFVPGKIGEHIPSSSTAKLRLVKGYQVVKPSRELRSPWYSGPRPLGRDWKKASMRKWFRRNRHGGIRGYYGHHWHRIYTRELLEEEPDLAPFYEGKRHSEVSAHKGQVCLSNPKAVDVAAKYFIRFFEGNPQFDFYSFAANDGRGWCECENCKAMASNDAARVLIVANKVMERLAAVHPTKKLAFQVYNNTFAAPKEKIKAHENLIGVVCSAGVEGKPWMDQIKPKTDDHRDGISFRRNVERWMKILSTVWTYDYVAWFPGPYTMFHKLQADHDYYASVGITGDGSEHIDRNMGTDVHMWLLLRVGWDQNQRVEDLLEQFYPAYFGEAAEDMQYVYERLENHMRTATTEAVHEVEVSNSLGLYPLDLLEDALAKVARAKGKVRNDPKILARIERDERCLKSTQLFIKAYSATRAYYRTGDPKDREKAVAAADAYLERYDRRHVPLPYAARNLFEPFVLTKPGPFVLADGMSRGDGRSWRAKSCSGFKVGDWGLNLAPNASGEIVYEVRTSEGLKFKDARCRVAHQGQIAVEISWDGGKTWRSVPEDINTPGWRDLGRYVAGRNQFLIALRAQNDSAEEVMSLDSLRIKGNIE